MTITLHNICTTALNSSPQAVDQRLVSFHSALLALCKKQLHLATGRASIRLLTNRNTRVILNGLAVRIAGWRLRSGDQAARATQERVGAHDAQIVEEIGAGCGPFEVQLGTTIGVEV